jgi:hypothetical protein
MRSTIAAAALVFTIACGGSKPPAEQPTLDFPDAAPPPPPPADASLAETPVEKLEPKTFTISGPPVKVQRLTKGKGKGTQLRYAFVDGTSQVVDTTLDVQTELTANGQTQNTVTPTQTIGRVVEVTGVDAQGTAMIKSTMDRGSAADAMMTEMLEQLKGTVIEGSVDARGRAGDVSVTSFAQDTTGAKMVEGLIEFRTRAIVLPEEPVGTGGTWQVTSHANITGIETEVTTTYKLVKREATAWTITGEMTAVAPAQRISAEAMGAGAGGPVDVKSMTGKGTLTVTIDPTRAAPTSEYLETYEAVLTYNGVDVKIGSKIQARQTHRDR